MLSRFDWNDLRFFLAVARAGTVSAAARRLGVDHATVIRRLDSLEQGLGAKLFVRNPRGYALSQTGERLIPAAEVIEAETLRIERRLDGADSAIAGLIRLSTLEGFGNFFLAARLPAFIRAHPGISVELVTIQQIAALSRREVDLAITLTPPTGGRFVQERLTDYTLFIYGARSYLDGAPPIRDRGDLSAHPFIGYIDDLVFTRSLDYLDEVAPGLSVTLRSSSLHAQMEAVRAGHGLCVLPAFMADPHADLARVLPEAFSLRRSYWLISHAEAAETARIRAVRRFIKAQAEAARTLFLGSPPSLTR